MVDTPEVSNLGRRDKARPASTERLASREEAMNYLIAALGGLSIAARSGLSIAALSGLSVAALSGLSVAADASPTLFGDVGHDQSRLVPTDEGACGTLLLNADGTYENAIALRGEILTPPYGTFSECYEGTGAVCAVVVDLTTTSPTPTETTLDVYVWDDGEGVPGTVLCVETGFEPGEIAVWPEVSRHSFALPEGCCVDGTWWAGKYDDWGTEPTVFFWYLGADLDGFGGCPRVNIAPDLGYPSGWQNVSVIFGPIQAIGIGAEIVPCDPVPVRDATWGGVKSLYR